MLCMPQPPPDREYSLARFENRAYCCRPDLQVGRSPTTTSHGARCLFSGSSRQLLRATSSRMSGTTPLAAAIAPGAFHFRGFLSPDRQRQLAAECRSLIDGAVPAYVPIVRGGGKMHVRMLCLGRHWNGKTYRYETSRTDFDGLPAPPLPESFRTLAAECAAAAGMAIDADLCILNYYERDGRMGLHQDKD